MNYQDQPESKKPQNRTFKLNILLMIFCPVMFFIILVLLQLEFNDGSSLPGTFFTIPFEWQLLELLFILLGIAAVILTHLFFIPRFYKEEKMKMILVMIIIQWGSSIPAILGLIIGLIEILTDGIADWFMIILFFILSISHGIYLYFKIVDPFLKKN